MLWAYLPTVIGFGLDVEAITAGQGFGGLRIKLDMTSIPTTTALQVSAGAYTNFYSPSEKVPASVLDVPAHAQGDGSATVNDVLEGVSCYNKLLYMSQHTAWDAYAARFGQAATDKAKAEDIARIA